jgi:hypothetical protein
MVLLDINLPDIDDLEELKQIMPIPAPSAVTMLIAFSIPGLDLTSDEDVRIDRKDRGQRGKA